MHIVGIHTVYDIGEIIYLKHVSSYRAGREAILKLAVGRANFGS